MGRKIGRRIEDMAVVLRRASEADLPELWDMQVRAFRPLLEKYRNDSTNPACEPLEKVCARFRQPNTDYYVICEDGQPVGGVRVVRREGSRCRIAPLFVVPEHQGRGVAKAAMHLLEELYPSVQWELNTILQETGNCRLYEKMGYRRTGEYEKVNERMTLVYYRKLTIKRTD